MEFKTFESIKIGLASPDEIRSWSFGEVKKPGPRTLPPDKTISASQAIALAGGFTQVAKQNDITLIRNKEIKKLNLKKLYSSIENMERDETLRNGDILFVQESIW